MFIGPAPGMTTEFCAARASAMPIASSAARAAMTRFMTIISLVQSVPGLAAQRDHNAAARLRLVDDLEVDAPRRRVSQSLGYPAGLRFVRRNAHPGAQVDHRARHVGGGVGHIENFVDVFGQIGAT